GRFDLSFSGFKTAVWQHVRDHPPSREELPDVAASVEEALVDMLVATTAEGLDASGAERLVVSGGVSANRRLRERVAALGEERGVEVVVPRPALCTDNAAMVALAGWTRLAAGEHDDLTVAADAAPPFGVAWSGGSVRGGRRAPRSRPPGSGRRSAGASTSCATRPWPVASSTRPTCGQAPRCSRSVPDWAPSPTSSRRGRGVSTWSRSTAVWRRG